jgi:hypothetical protein
MPSGETQYEVQEILNHFDDADNERWDDGSISFIPERDAYNCWERVKEYFAKHGLTVKRPPRLSKRTRVHKETELNNTPIPIRDRVESLKDQTETDSSRRSERLRLKTLMCMYQARAHAYEYGKSFPELY